MRKRIDSLSTLDKIDVLADELENYEEEEEADAYTEELALIGGLTSTVLLNLPIERPKGKELFVKLGIPHLGGLL